MPNHNLTTRPAVAKIKHAPGTTMYSDPSVKPDPDARGIRLAVGATTKTWVLSKRIDGKVRSVTLGSWPELPTVYAARDVAVEKMAAITTRTDDRSTGKFDVDEAWPALDLIEAKKGHNLIIGTAWEVMLFTGLRAKNVTELRWADIDLDSARLRVAELKNGTEGAFPIADRVVAALRALPRHSEWVFPQHDTEKHIYHPQQLKGDGIRMTPHDARRLFTTAARRLRLPSYIIDQLRGDMEKGVQDLYDQGSMSHKDANAIAKQIEVECGAVPSSNVVQIGGRR